MKLSAFRCFHLRGMIRLLSHTWKMIIKRCHGAIDLSGSGDGPWCRGFIGRGPISHYRQRTKHRSTSFELVRLDGGEGDDFTFFSLNKNYRLIKLKSLILKQGWFNSYFWCYSLKITYATPRPPESYLSGQVLKGGFNTYLNPLTKTRIMLPL